METAPFKIYSASAGSGKTFTLVKEYLKVCLCSASPQKFISILAVTFTNKAASEMKNRVLLSLKAFSDPKNAEQTELEMMDLISSETGLGRVLLQKRSQLIFENILHRYSRFSVGTIDKFTHRVLKTFAQDIDLPGNFEVEIEQSLLLKQSVDLLINRAGEDENLTRLFVSFIQSKTESDKSWLIENDFYKVAEELLKESGQNHCDRLKTLSLDKLFVLKKSLDDYISAIDRLLAEVGKKFAEYCDKNNIESRWIAGGAQSGLPKYFNYLETMAWEKYIPSSRNQSYIEKEDWHSAKAPVEAQKEISGLRDLFYPLVLECLSALEAYPKYTYFKLIDRNLFSVGVLQEVSKEMQRIKEQNNIIPIGEFNKKIATVLQNEGGEFIYERLGERYSNYFIDEFQDTSLLQWNNLIPLIENAIADGQRPGSAMVVGDAKQAIYRWRGGDVDQFLSLQAYATNTKRLKPYKMELVSLQKNYRSKSEIVEFNNELFSSIARQISSSEYAPLYERLNAHAERGPGGMVSIEYIEGGSQHDDEQLLRALQTVKELNQDGFSYGDICILTRTKAKGAVVVKMLSDEDIPVISSESLLLEQSPEVRFILNFLRFLEEPTHPAYRFKILEFLMAQNYSQKKKGSTSEVISSLCKESVERFLTFLSTYTPHLEIEAWRGLPLLRLCHKISRSFELEKTAGAYVTFFLDVVVEYGNRYSQDLFGFLNYWEERADKFSVAVPEEIDAVQVMTIHKSKGLEFPVVLFPFANWDATTERDAKSWVEVDEPELHGLTSALIPISSKLNSSTKALKEIYEGHKTKVVLDNLNMLYVALTRAKTRLHIFTSTKEKKKNLNLYFDAYLKGKNLWVDGKKEYVFGEKIAQKKKPLHGNKYIKAVKPIIDLNRVLKINRTAPKAWDVNNPEISADRGRKIHEVLSYIVQLDDLDGAIKKALCEGLISKSEKDEVRKLVEDLIYHPDVKPYFSPGLKVKNEEEIFRSNADALRPDRLVFEKDCVTIIDYKTGRILEEHKAQIFGYKFALEEMGYCVKFCVLAYVNNDGVIVKKF